MIAMALAAMELLARAAIAGIFCAAGVAKLGDQGRARFAATLAAHGFQDELLRRFLTRAVPYAEIVAGFGVLVPHWSGPILAAFLAAAFAAELFWNYARGRRSIPCGCFGNDTSRGISLLHIASNLLVAVAATALAVTTSAVSGAGLTSLCASGVLLTLAYSLVRLLTRTGSLGA